MHTCHLASHVAGRWDPDPTSGLYLSGCGMRHTRWLIPYFQVWHAPHLLAHPSLVGCGATTPISMHLFYRVCYCHPQICQGAPNNLSPIYCQMVFNFIVHLYKRPKLLMVELTTRSVSWRSHFVSFLKSCYNTTHVLLGLSSVNARGQVTRKHLYEQSLLFDVCVINISYPRTTITTMFN